MSVLILDAATVARLIDYARAHPLDADQVEALSRDYDPEDATTRTPGQHLPDDYSILQPVGYQITFTFEEQPVGLCRHLSVSISDDGRVPNLPTLAQIAKAFGFARPIEECMLWPEKFESGTVAVNILEPVAQ